MCPTSPKPLLVVPGKNILLKPQATEAVPTPQHVQLVRVVCPSCGNVREILPKKARFEMRCQGADGCGAKLRVDLSDTIHDPAGGPAVTAIVLKGRVVLPVIGKEKKE